MSNIPKIKHEQMSNMLNVSYNTLTPLMFHGTFGIGKSWGVKEWAKAHAKKHNLEYSDNAKHINDEKYFVCIVMALHQFDAAGFNLPVFNDGEYSLLMNSLFPVKGQGLIFFDEINLAPPLVQANAYQILLDRKLNQYVVPEGFGICAAGNTIEDNAHITTMATPLKNRMLHVNLTVPSAEDWVNNFAIPFGIDQRVTSYLSYMEQHLYRYDQDNSEDDYAIASPRSWEFTSRIIKGVDDIDEVNLLASSAVGCGIARSFTSWLKLTKKVKIADIFKKKSVSVPQEADQLYALISAMLGYFEQHKDHKTGRVVEEVAVTLAELSMMFQSEHAVLILRQAKTMDEKFFETLKISAPKLFKDLANKYVKLLI